MTKDLKAAMEEGRQRLDQIARENAANAERLNQLTAKVDSLTREMRVLFDMLSLPDASLWKGGPADGPAAPAANAFPRSTVCRQESFEQPYFPYWIRRLGREFLYHRKLWEFAFICQSLWERGMIREGRRGLGFGVGREELVALFAAEGCDIVATDMGAEDAMAQGWSATRQHSASLDPLRRPQICPPEVFDRRVSFRVCDMNAVPDDLTDFDFCWSACAFEHLGSIEKGLAFVERSIACLKPGGWAVHTTEFNLSSNGETIETGGTVLFRRRDMEALAARLKAKGHQAAPFDFDPGFAPLDRYIDVAPYRQDPHLKLSIQGYATTSIGVIVQRGA